MHKARPDQWLLADYESPVECLNDEVKYGLVWCEESWYLPT